MGRKHARQRKHLYIIVACLITVILAGCGGIKEDYKQDQSEQMAQDTLSQPEETVEEDEEQDQIIAEEVQKKDQMIAEEVQKKDQKSNDAPNYLLLAQKHMAKGNFDASFDASQKSLARSGKKSPGDEALFHMGLLFAHYNNQKKDYKKSISYFERLLREYPQSHLTEQAKIWLAVLNMIEQSKQVDIQIEEMKKELLKK